MKILQILKRAIISCLLIFFVAVFFSCNQGTEKAVRIEKKRTSPATDVVGAAAYEFNMLKDPVTKRIPAGIRELELAQAREILANQTSTYQPLINTYSFVGPGNLGGRIRGMAYDSRYNGTTNRIILAGGVSGGLFKSTDDGATWVRKGPTDALYSVISIAQDPGTDTWYYSTGEPIGNSASAVGAFYCGDGVYKSTDNGETWAKLPASNTGVLEDFDRRQDFILKIAVHPTNGHVYMAAIDGIYRSTDAGLTWSSVLSSNAGGINSGMVTDVVIASNGRIFASFSGSNNTAPRNVPGVWTSPTGASGTWDKIAGDSSLTTPAGWNANGSYGRVVLALAPSSENLLYAVYWNGLENDCLTEVVEAELFRWDTATATWTDLSAQVPNEPGCSAGNDPFAVQGGYDLVMAVKPDDPNVVFLGGTNIYRSTDAFASAVATTRIGGYASPVGYAQYPNSHADIHSIVFTPGSPNTMLCGNDGGIQLTTNNLAPIVTWTQMNVGFLTYQYYDVTIDPRPGNGKVLGGAQDNGTTRNIGGIGIDFEQILSGDGVSVGLSNDIGGVLYEYCGFQEGPIYRRESTLAPYLGIDIRPATTVSNPGLFVTLFHLDPDNSNTIYYANDDSLFRNTSASTANPGNWTSLTGVSGALAATEVLTALETTRGTYAAGTSSLFVGTSLGTLLRLDDPENAAAGAPAINITGPTFPFAYMSSIAVNPRNDDTVIVAFSNYGTTNIWWTGDANSAAPTWINIERNLTLPSIRSSAIVVTGSTVEYFVGTSVGLFRTSNPATTDWTQEGPTSIGNAVVTSLALRTADNMLLAGTHGYAMWQASITALPVTFGSFTGRIEQKWNKLMWETSDEYNNKGFELERRYGGADQFKSIAFIPGRNTSGKHSYIYSDRSFDLGKENISYRLKQVDWDGRASYSPIVTLNRRASKKIIEYVSVLGNNLFLRINQNGSNQPLNVRLFNSEGKMLKSNNIPFQTQSIDISHVPKGAYMIEITTKEGERFTQRFVK